MASPLPPDVWQHVSLFLPSDVLSRVCRRLWQCLGRRYVVRCASAADLRRAVHVCQNARSLDLRLRLGPALQQAAECDCLTTARLALGPWGGSGGDRLVQPLEALKRAPALQTLCLDLRHTPVGARGARALAAVHAAPALRALTLDLEGAALGPPGAKALAALAAARRLRTLTLRLGRNALGDGGLAALAALGAAPALHTLALDLQVGMRSKGVEGEGPRRRPQRRLGWRLEEVAEAVGGGYCRLPMPLKHNWLKTAYTAFALILLRLTKPHDIGTQK